MMRVRRRRAGYHPDPTGWGWHCRVGLLWSGSFHLLSCPFLPSVLGPSFFCLLLGIWSVGGQKETWGRLAAQGKWHPGF